MQFKKHSDIFCNRNSKRYAQHYHKKEESAKSLAERYVHRARPYWGAEEEYGTQDQPFELFNYEEISKHWKVLETIGTATVVTSDRSASATTATAVI